MGIHLTSGHTDFPANDAERRTLWAPLYAAALEIIGTGGVIVPLGDTNHENSGRTTCTTVGDIANVFTYTEAVTLFTTPPAPTGPAGIPEVAFSTDEKAAGTDAAFWTVDDNAGANGFTMGAWCNVTDTATSRAIWTKYRLQATNDREWMWTISADDTLIMELFDESVQVTASRASDSAITQGSMAFFACVYDGTGGATAADGITLYLNGASIASTATNHASYVGMEDTPVIPEVGGSNGTTNERFYAGTMAGGPLGPFWTTKQLTADELLRLYQMGRAALNV